LIYYRRVVLERDLRGEGSPAFLGLVADPVRWRLLCELGRSDRQVRELVGLVGQPQSLVSYHLGRLRAAGLVSMRRSSADRRDAYYRVELPVCGERLGEVGAALHPGLGLVGAGPAHTGSTAVRSRRRCRVLFLCTGNSARSQMAEAFIEHLASGRVEAHSAGSHPKELHPNAVRAMAARGIDISGRRTKHLSEFARRRFDHVVSLCDRVREVCPQFPGDPETVHWSIADPSAAGTTDDDSYPAFERAAIEIEWRAQFLLARIENPAREKFR
jgi:ArsR family transcriptional regulator, arsenate/arsenite/antimonite-responsive transcriptional repressor / arsenate reductase (thioredoxin)